jgi:hypothetical protein
MNCSQNRQKPLRTLPPFVLRDGEVEELLKGCEGTADP